MLSQTYWLPDGKPWRDWQIVEPNSDLRFTGSPTTVYNPVSKTAEVFATTTKGPVAHAYFTPGMTGWSGWSTIGTRSFAGSPSAVFDPATGGIELFAVGDGVLSRTEWLPDGKPWRDWTAMQDWKFSAGRVPSATFNAAASTTDLFATGSDGAMNHASYKTESGWSGWKTIGGTTLTTG